MEMNDFINGYMIARVRLWLSTVTVLTMVLPFWLTLHFNNKKFLWLYIAEPFVFLFLCILLGLTGR